MFDKIHYFNSIFNGYLTVAHKGQCNKKWSAANKEDRMQTKNQNLSRCKQKRSNANKNDRMQTKKIGCKKKTKTCHDANKKDRMQTKKIGCKQKTKTCHDASSSLGQLTLSLATSYKLQIMILKL